MNKDFVVGVMLTLVGGVLWGFSGTCAQFIQQERFVNSEWLVTFRLLVAGIVTVSYAFWQGRAHIFKIFTNKLDTWRLFIFGVFGMGLCQYSYFKSIFYAGAGVATVLQYVAPVLIIIYLAIFYHKKPSRGELVSVALALGGTILIALKGELSLAALNGDVLFWGGLSAIAVAIYTIQPMAILMKYGTGPVVGFGMLFGGVAAYLSWRPTETTGVWDGWAYAALLGIVVLGTIVSFNVYMEGVRRIGAVKGSIICSVEPVAAAILSWLMLGNQFTTTDMIGFAMIVSTIFILAREKEKN